MQRRSRKRGKGLPPQPTRSFPTPPASPAPTTATETPEPKDMSAEDLKIWRVLSETPRGNEPTRAEWAALSPDERESRRHAADFRQRTRRYMHLQHGVSYLAPVTNNQDAPRRRSVLAEGVRDYGY